MTTLNEIQKIISDSQYEVLTEWIEANKFDVESLEYDKELLNGIRIWASRSEEDEAWEIDFVFTNKENKAKNDEEK